MNPFQKTRAAIIGLTVYLICGPLPLSALNPGDVALTRITPDSVILLALVDIPANERIIFTDIRWLARGFDTDNAGGKDGFYVWFAPAADGVGSNTVGLAAGEQVEIDFPADSVFLQWQEYLFLFQGSVDNPVFLYSVFADVDWNLWDNPARGLNNDITSTTIGTISGAPTNGDGSSIINHEIKSELRDNFSNELDQLGWLRKFTNISSWTWVANNIDAIDNRDFGILTSQGLIEFASDRHLIKDDRGVFSITLRRLYGSEGAVSVRLSTTTRISDYSALKPRTSGTFDDLTGIAHGNSTFVVVSSGEGTLTSPNGFDWTLHATPFDNLQGVAFGMNRFAAVGDDGLIIVSADGATWTSQTSPTEVSLFGIEFINGAFYAVGEENTILTSTNAITWTRVNGGNTSGALYGITFGNQIGGEIADNNLFVAVGKEGAIFTSTDGATWTPATSDFTEQTLWEVIYTNNGFNGFTAVADEGRVLVSADGLNWEEKRSGARLSLFAVTAAGSTRVAVGSEGLIISTEDDTVFKPTRRRVRATSLYDIIFASGTAVVVGEYGRILSASVTGGTELSASSATDFTPVSNAAVFWADGDAEPKTQTISFAQDLSTNLARKRFDLRIFQGFNDPDLGVSTTEISLFSTNPLRNRIVNNYGAFLTFKNVNVSRDEADDTQPHQLSFQVQNTSSTASGALRMQFDGSNLPDLDLEFNVAANSVSEIVQIDLSEIVQAISLFELLTDDDEPVFKHKRFINSVFIVDDRAGNGVKSGTLGRGFVTNLVALPGEILATNSSSNDKDDGSIKPLFSGGTPPPPPGEGGGEGFGLVLTEIELTGNASVETGGLADFTAIGTFLDPFTFEEFEEELADPQPDWLLDPQSFPINENGQITANPNPVLIYPQASALTASAIDGAPVDDEGIPIPVVGNLSVNIDEPAGNQDYPAWVIAQGLSGGASGEKEDFEGDGLANLLEFSLGTDPTVENPEGLPFHIVDKGGGSYTIQYTRPKSRKGVVYKLQKSTAFHPWSDLGQTLFEEDEFTETWEASATENSPANFRLVIERFDQ